MSFNKEKQNVYRSIRRILGVLQSNDVELSTYLENNVILEGNPIHKHLMNLNEYLKLERCADMKYKIGNENITTVADLLYIILDSGFNTDKACLVFNCNVVYDDNIYTLIYYDCENKNASRIDSFIINRGSKPIFIKGNQKYD